jgi:hypothetical protein
VINEKVDSAVAAISSIIEAEGSKRSRDGELDGRVKDLVTGIQRAIDHYSARK